MGLIQLLRPWTEQPQGVTGAAAGDALSDRLVGLFNLTTARPADLITGYSSPGTWVVSPTRRGIGAYPSGSYTGTVKTILPGTGPVSGLVVAAPLAEATNRPFFSQRPSGGGGQWSFVANANVAFVTAAGDLTLISGSGIALTKAGVITGEVASYGFVVSSTTTGSLYVNGEDVGASVSGSGYPTITNPDFNLGYHAGAGAVANKPILMLALWARALSAQEMREVSANPWRLFADRVIPIPLAAAGGAITIDGAVGNAVAAGVIGATGVSIEIAGAVGNATAAGVTGTPAVSIDLSGAVGNAVAAGIFGTPGVSIDISGSVGDAVAAGVTGAADVGGNITIDGAVGNAVAAGVAGLPGVAITIDGSVGNATAAGITGQADIGILISGSVGNAAAAGVAGALSLDIVVPGVVGDAVAAGVAGTVSVLTSTWDGTTYRIPLRGQARASNRGAARAALRGITP